MPRSSRHKSHKQSKHSSKEHSDSENGLSKMKERSRKDESYSRALGDPSSSEKRKTSSLVREDRNKEASVHVNGEVLEEHVSSKRRKGKVDAFVDGDRWNGGGDVKFTSDRAYKKELDKGNSMRVDEKHRHKSSKGESLELDNNKSKRNELGFPGDKIEEISPPIVLEKEDKNRSVSKLKSDKDSSVCKDGRDSKDKVRRLDKERNGGYGSKSGDANVIVMDWDSKKKQSGNSGEERPSKKPRDNTEVILKNVMHSPEPEKEYEKRVRRKMEVSSEREKHPDDFKEGNERLGPMKADRSKNEKHRDVKDKDKGYAEKCLEDNHKSDRRKDESYLEKSDKDKRYYDENHREDGEKYGKRQDYRYREDGDRDIKRKDEKCREDGKRDTNLIDGKSRVTEDGIYDKYHEEADRNIRRKDECYHEFSDRDVRCVDVRYLKDGDGDDKRISDRGESERRHKDEKYRDDAEKDIRKNANPGEEIDRDKRQRESKYDGDFKDFSGDRSDKRSGNDSYPADSHARKSSTYDETPNHDNETPRHKDDQYRRRSNEKENYGEGKSQSRSDQRSDPGKRSSNLDSSSDRTRNTSRNADSGHSSHSKRRGSPSSSSHGLRDNYRSLKQDESKYRDNNDERPRDSLASTRAHVGSLERPEKTASRSLVSNDYSQPHEQSSKRHHKSDSHSSPLQRTGGSRDRKGRREMGLDAGLVEERVQADDNIVSISSPSMKNNHSSGNSRSSQQPPLLRSLDIPLTMGSAEDDGRSKSQSHHRRIGDPSVGRIQGNIWRGAPTWPSPMPNGFLPFPHAPPPIGFHPVMHPFPAPPIFGVRPSMDLNPHSSYQMPDHDRYFGPGHPMGWQNQVNDTRPPMQPWDANVAAYVDESHICGRSDWDQSQNMAVGHGWDSTDDAWKEANTAKVLEGQSVGKENNSPHVGNEANQSRNFVDQQEDCMEVRLSTNNAVVPFNSAEDNNGLEKRDTLGLCKAYLCKLDISVDLADPELLSKLTNLISSDQVTVSDFNDSKILFMEDLEAKMSTVTSPSSAVLSTIDDSIFQRSISLYNKQKQQNMHHEDVTNSEALIESNPKSFSPKAIPMQLTIDEYVTEVTSKVEESVSTLSDKISVDKIASCDGFDAFSAPHEADEPMVGSENKDENHPSSPISERRDSVLETRKMDESTADETLQENFIENRFSSPIALSEDFISGSDPQKTDESMAGTENEVKNGVKKQHPYSPIEISDGFVAGLDPHKMEESIAGTENEVKNGNKEASLSKEEVSPSDNDIKKPIASSDRVVSALVTNESSVSNEFDALVHCDMAEVIALNRIHHSH